MQEAPVIYKRMVTDRSRNWLPKVEELAQGKENAIVIVGAGHLVGAEGVVELLKKKGFKISAGIATCRGKTCCLRVRLHVPACLSHSLRVSSGSEVSVVVDPVGEFFRGVLPAFTDRLRRPNQDCSTSQSGSDTGSRFKKLHESALNPSIRIVSDSTKPFG
jgi:pheromone shutdown protein TraB